MASFVNAQDARYYFISSCTRPRGPYDTEVGTRRILHTHTRHVLTHLRVYFEIACPMRKHCRRSVERDANHAVAPLAKKFLASSDSFSSQASSILNEPELFSFSFETSHLLFFGST